MGVLVVNGDPVDVFDTIVVREILELPVLVLEREGVLLEVPHAVGDADAFVVAERVDVGRIVFVMNGELLGDELAVDVLLFIGHLVTVEDALGDLELKLLRLTVAEVEEVFEEDVDDVDVRLEVVVLDTVILEDTVLELVVDGVINELAEDVFD